VAKGKAPKKFNGSPRSLKTAKEPEKYRLEPHFTKQKIDFFFQFPVQFGRRAAKRRGGNLDLSEVVDYS